MALHYDFSPRAADPEPPDRLAHEANDFAIRGGDAQASARALEGRIRTEMGHPVAERVRNAAHSRGIVLYTLCALAFVLVARWEWTISREVYAVLMPGAAWLPFLGCMAVGLLASACLAEATPQFALELGRGAAPGQTAEQSVIRNLYGRARQKRAEPPNWLLNPLTGLLVAVLITAFVLWASRARVAWMRQAGELVGDGFQVYLPAILYAVEILLGIPTLFVVVWVYSVIRVRRARLALSRERDRALTLRSSALGRYAEYVSALDQYNDSARRRGCPERRVIPAGEPLRILLTEEFQEAGPAPDGEHNQPNGVASGPTPAREPRPANDGEQPSGASTDGQDRVNDLLNLMDDLTGQGNARL